MKSLFLPAFLITILSPKLDAQRFGGVLRMFSAERSIMGANGLSRMGNRSLYTLPEYSLGRSYGSIYEGSSSLYSGRIHTSPYLWEDEPATRSELLRRLETEYGQKFIDISNRNNTSLSRRSAEIMESLTGSGGGGNRIPPTISRSFFEDDFNEENTGRRKKKSEKPEEPDAPEEASEKPEEPELPEEEKQSEQSDNSELPDDLFSQDTVRQTNTSGSIYTSETARKKTKSSTQSFSFSNLGENTKNALVLSLLFYWLISAGACYRIFLKAKASKGAAFIPFWRLGGLFELTGYDAGDSVMLVLPGYNIYLWWQFNTRLCRVFQYPSAWAAVGFFVPIALWTRLAWSNRYYIGHERIMK